MTDKEITADEAPILEVDFNEPLETATQDYADQIQEDDDDA